MRQIRNEVPRKTFDFRVGFRLFAVIDSYKGDVASSIFLKFTFITDIMIVGMKGLTSMYAYD